MMLKYEKCYSEKEKKQCKGKPKFLSSVNKQTNKQTNNLRHIKAFKNLYEKNLFSGAGPNLK